VTEEQGSLGRAAWQGTGEVCGSGVDVGSDVDSALDVGRKFLFSTFLIP